MLMFCCGDTMSWYFLVYILLIIKPVHSVDDSPIFMQPIGNVTVPVGREAVLSCIVDNLQSFKVAWLRVDTQTILSIASHVITKNHRVVVTRGDHRTWRLHLRDVRPPDRGLYMCQINTEPMMSQTGYLEVVVPPDIMDIESSGDLVVNEGQAVVLRCAATGTPPPIITWRREDGRPIRLNNSTEVSSWTGASLNISLALRRHGAAFLCIASNGVPPSVSKRIMLNVMYPPSVWVPNQLVGAELGQNVTLECNLESSPRAVISWYSDSGDLIAARDRFQPTMVARGFRASARLTIANVTSKDYGTFRCLARNSLGEADGNVKLYMLIVTTPSTTTEATTTPLTEAPTTKITPVVKKLQRQRQNVITVPVPVPPPAPPAPLPTSATKLENTSFISKHRMNEIEFSGTLQPDSWKEKISLLDVSSSASLVDKSPTILSYIILLYCRRISTHFLILYH